MSTPSSSNKPTLRTRPTHRVIYDTSYTKVVGQENVWTRVRNAQEKATELAVKGSERKKSVSGIGIRNRKTPDARKKGIKNAKRRSFGQIGKGQRAKLMKWHKDRKAAKEARAVENRDNDKEGEMGVELDLPPPSPSPSPVPGPSGSQPSSSDHQLHSVKVENVEPTGLMSGSIKDERMLPSVKPWIQAPKVQMASRTASASVPIAAPSAAPVLAPTNNAGFMSWDHKDVFMWLAKKMDVKKHPKVFNWIETKKPFMREMLILMRHPTPKAFTDEEFKELKGYLVELKGNGGAGSGSGAK